MIRTCHKPDHVFCTVYDTDIDILTHPFCRECQHHDPTHDSVTMRRFSTGATRDNDQGKLDYEGFLSPRVLERFAQYMHKHRVQSDGSLRDSDNWQKGIPLSAYMKSLWRHFMDLWKEHRGLKSREGLEDALCGLMFNVMGYLHEMLIQREGGTIGDEKKAAEKVS